MALQRFATQSEILQALPMVFGGAAVLSREELLAGLAAAGLRLAKPEAQTLSEALDASPDAYLHLGEDRGHVASAGALVEGVTFTHRVTEIDLQSDRLDAAPDFDGPILVLMATKGLDLPDGSRIEPFAAGSADEDYQLPITLPPGTLASMGLQAGDLVGITSAGGAVRLIVPDEPGPDRLAPVLAARLGPESVAIPVMGVVTAALARGQWPIGVNVPTSEAAVAAGLGCDGRKMAAPGVPLSSPRADFDLIAEDLGDTYGLHGEDAESIAFLLMLAERLQPVALDMADLISDGSEAALLDVEASLQAVTDQAAQDSGVPFSRAALVLDDPLLVTILANEALDDFDPAPFGLLLLTERIALIGGAVPKIVRAGLSYLRGRIEEAIEGALSAEPQYRAALALCPDYSPALTELAGFELDRANFRSARTLAERAELMPEHPIVDLLADIPDHLGAPATPVAGSPRAGRNQACPCGSGRKYKLCHGHPRNAVAPVPVRDLAHILYDKAIVYLQMRHGRSLAEVLDLAEGPNARELAPTIIDLLLIRDGLLQDYFEMRGELLQPKERELLETWMENGHRLFEVQASRPGEGMDLRDTTTGERYSITERSASQVVRANMLIYTRLADVGEGMEIYGGVTIVRPHEVEAFQGLDEMDAYDTIEWLTQRAGPPTLVTPEGDKLVLHTALFTTTAHVKLARELDALFHSQGTGRWELLSGPLPDDPDEGFAEPVSIIATLQLNGRELKVEAMSEARLHRVLERLENVTSKLKQTRLTTTPMSQLLAAGTAQEAGPSGALSDEEVAADPAMQAALADYTAKYETKWLDMELPALRGMTPRQAADDPTRREDLIRLLAGMPRTDDPTKMDAGRLARALGLE